METKKIKFIRKNGRVIPIFSKEDKTNIKKGVAGVAGGVISAEVSGRILSKQIKIGRKENRIASMLTNKAEKFAVKGNFGKQFDNLLNKSNRLARSATMRSQKTVLFSKRSNILSSALIGYGATKISSGFGADESTAGIVGGAVGFGAATITAGAFNKGLKGIKRSKTYFKLAKRGALKLIKRAILK